PAAHLSLTVSGAARLCPSFPYTTLFRSQSNYRSREVGEAMRALDMARVIQLIYPTTSLTPPIVTDIKKRPRLQVLDTGLLNHAVDRKSTRLNSSHVKISYAVFCLTKKNT